MLLPKIETGRLSLRAHRADDLEAAYFSLSREGCQNDETGFYKLEFSEI